MILSKVYAAWDAVLTLVKPATVIGWRKTAFKLYWKSKSKKIGRPKISSEAIALIKRIHKDNPLLSPEKIHELLVSLGVTNAPAPNTISKYFPSTRKPPSHK